MINPVQYNKVECHDLRLSSAHGQVIVWAGIQYCCLFLRYHQHMMAHDGHHLYLRVQLYHLYNWKMLGHVIHHGQYHGGKLFYR